MPLVYENASCLRSLPYPTVQIRPFGDLATLPSVAAAADYAARRARFVNGELPLAALGQQYSTTFPLTESPMVEDGGWIQGSAAGIHDVNTSGGLAFSPLGGVGGATDGVAHRTGFAANHWASAVIHKSGTLSDFFEVELLLRCTSSGGSIQYYEINLAWDGRYCQVVRCHKVFADAELTFDFIVSNFSNQPNPSDGDVFYAQIVGNIITVKLNGTLIGTCDITSIGGAVYSTGNPGMGFFRGEPALSGLSANQYCFDSWSAGTL